jgi:hypothetical protein
MIAEVVATTFVSEAASKLVAADRRSDRGVHFPQLLRAERSRRSVRGKQKQRDDANSQ